MPRHASKKPFALRGLAVNFLLCIAAVSLTFGGAEAIARLKFKPQKVHSQGIFEYDREKLFRLKPNQDNATYFYEPFKTNSYGYRGVEIPMEKPDHTKRVVLIGDSITFGIGMRDEQIYASRLQELLNKEWKENETFIQVINTGVPGNAPFQEYIDFERSLRFQPDVIVLQLTLNDILESDGIWIMREIGMANAEDKDTWYYNYLFGKLHMSRINYFLRQRSALYLFLEELYIRMRFGTTQEEGIRQLATQEERAEARKLLEQPDSPEVHRAWNNAFFWIGKIQYRAEEENIPLIVMFVPYDNQFEKGGMSSYPQELMANFLSKGSSEYVDLLPLLEKDFSDFHAAKQQSDPERIKIYWYSHFLDYCHPNIEGHRFIANILLPHVITKLSSDGEDLFQ